jgi:hypothetical protein
MLTMSKIPICDICEGEKVLSLATRRMGYKNGLKGYFCVVHARQAKGLMKKSRSEFEAWLAEHVLIGSVPMTELAKWPYRGLNTPYQSLWRR